MTRVARFPAMILSRHKHTKRTNATLHCAAAHTDTNTNGWTASAKGSAYQRHAVALAVRHLDHWIRAVRLLLTCSSVVSSLRVHATKQGVVRVPVIRIHLSASARALERASRVVFVHLTVMHSSCLLVVVDHLDELLVTYCLRRHLISLQ